MNKTDLIIKNMTVEEKVGQMCVAMLETAEITDDVKAYVKDYRVGMLRYCPNARFDNASEVIGSPNKYFTAAQTAHFTKEIQSMAKIPLFFAVDQEGGSRNDINRDGAFAYGGHMQFGAADDTYLTYCVAKQTAEEFAAMGVNMVQAPIVDVLEYEGRRTMKAATFGDDVNKVCAHARAMMHGFADGGIAVMAKHFPGYGSVSTDAHKGIAEITKDFSSLEEKDIRPMIELFREGLGGIMTGHVVTHCLDTENPATTSKAVIDGYLRKKLGFDGIVETDAMRMPAIQKLYGTAKATAAAVAAGCDLVLLRGDAAHFKEGYNALLAAVKSGEIHMARIDEAVRRILVQKERIGLLSGKLSNEEAAAKIVGCAEHKKTAAELAKRAVTLEEGSGLNLSRNAKILTICCEMQKIRAACDAVQSIDMLERAFKEDYKNTDGIIIKLKPDDDDLAEIDKALAQKEYDAVIFASCNAIIHTQQLAAAKKVRDMCKNMTIIALESPYDIEILPQAENFVNTYGVSYEAMRAAVMLLDGRIKQSGHCPVKIKK